MRTSYFLLMGFVATLAACSSDSTPTSTSTGDTSTSPTGLTLSADTSLTSQGVVAGSVIPMSIHVTQGGAPAPNIPVTWAVAAGGGTLASTSTVTDSTGLTTVNWVVGDTVGTNTMTASITGAMVLVNTVTTAGPASTLIKVSPDSQAVVAGAALTITARPVDRFGNGVSGIPVIWTATGGTLSATTTTSGGNGNATTNFVTNTTPGAYTVTGSVPGQASVTFTIVGS
jgi:adhesin/invasin